MWLDKTWKPWCLSRSKVLGLVGWLPKDTQMNVSPGATALLHPHTMWPFIALSCASMSHASAVSESALCGGNNWELKGLDLLTSSMTLSEFWNCFGLSIPICKVGMTLALYPMESWSSNEIITMKTSEEMWCPCQWFSDGSLSAWLLHVDS